MNNLSISILGDIFKGNYIYAIITIVARMFVVFCCLPVHELAHGWAAYKQGDDTAKKLFAKDLLASDLYRQVFCHKYNQTLPNEYQHSPIVL